MIRARSFVSWSMFACALMSLHITPIEHGIIFTIQMLAKIFSLFVRWCVEAIVVPCNKHKQVIFSMRTDKLTIKAALGSEGCDSPTGAFRALEQSVLPSSNLAGFHFREVHRCSGSGGQWVASVFSFVLACFFVSSDTAGPKTCYLAAMNLRKTSGTDTNRL